MAESSPPVIPVDIDRDAAHDAAQSELGKPIYPSASLWDRLTGWFEEILYRIMAEGSQVPGGWFTITVLLVLLVVSVVVAVRVAMRTMRTNRGGDSALFDSLEMSAAQHRVAAEQAAAQGDWAVAIRHRLRAVGRHLEETSVLTAVPGRTATELARDAGTAIPPLIGELGRAADTFNDVTYGDQPGSESAYRAVANLDEHLRTRTHVEHGGETTVGPHAQWANVR